MSEIIKIVFENFTNSIVHKISDLMSLSKIYVKPVAYLMRFKRMIRNTIGVFLIRNCKQTIKESIIPIEDVMLPEVFKIQKEGFENQRLDKTIKYSKKLRNF